MEDLTSSEDSQSQRSIALHAEERWNVHNLAPCSIRTHIFQRPAKVKKSKDPNDFGPPSYQLRFFPTFNPTNPANPYVKKIRQMSRRTEIINILLNTLPFY